MFTAQGCRAVWRYTKGVPRLINILCDTAFVYGYAAQRRTIDEALVREVARDKAKGGLFFTSEAEPPSQEGAAVGEVLRAEPQRAPAEPERANAEPTRVVPAELSRETARELFSGLRRRK